MTYNCLLLDAQPGDRVKFFNEAHRYTVAVRDSRYVVCSKPINFRPGQQLLTVADMGTRRRMPAIATPMAPEVVLATVRREGGWHSIPLVVEGVRNPDRFCAFCNRTTVCSMSRGSPCL